MTHEQLVWLDTHGGRTEADVFGGSIFLIARRGNYYDGDSYEAVKIPTHEEAVDYCATLGPEIREIYRLSTGGTIQKP